MSCLLVTQVDMSSHQLDIQMSNGGEESRLEM